MKKISIEGKLIMALTFAIAIFGIAMVYSASHYSAKSTYGDEFAFAKKQLIGVIVGSVAMCVMSAISVKKIKKYALITVVISAILLALVFVPVIGVEVYGAKRWLNLGVTTIQPSEIAKFAIILYTAKYLADNCDKSTSIGGVLPMLFVDGILVVLIFIEPNLSITVCTILVIISMLVFGGMKWKTLALFGVLGVCALPILIVIEPYRLLRLMAYLDPWKSPKGEGYQLIQSLYAISNGGLFGVGFLRSRQGLKFLTFAESDFILSIIAEEFGLLGITLLMLAYLTVFYLGIKIALSSRDRFSCGLAMGISSLFIIQTAINIAVVTGSIPPTGLPLPLISSGNTQVVVFMAEMGIIASISRGNFTFFSKLPYHKIMGDICQ